MKTPRAVLFQHHDNTDARLDALRHKVVAELPSATIARRESLPLQLALFVWRELILPARRIWAGLATIWLITIALNIASREDKPQAITQSNAASDTPEVQQALKQQRLLYAELAGLKKPTPTNPSPAPLPGPRSQRRPDTFIG